MTGLQSDADFTAPRTGKESRHGESWLARKAVLAAQQGDKEALHFLYVRYAPDVHCHVRNLVRGEWEAKEITQNVFRDLTVTIEVYDARREPFLDWLSGIAHDTALEHLDGMPRRASRV